MMTLTHLAFSGTVTALTLCTANPLMIGMGAIAGVLPDLDTPNSIPGRILLPLSKWISRWGHRQVTHSLIGTIVAWVAFLPLLLIGAKWYWAAAIGYFSGWLLDAASKTGVPIFYPSPRRLVFPLDPEFRLKTGSMTERLLQLLIIVVLGVVMTMNMSGGAVASFSNWLGSSSGAVDTYHRYAATREVWALVSGHHRLTQAAIAQEKMRVVGAASETDLVVRDGQGHLYRAGTGTESNIRTDRIQIELGKTIAVTVQPVEIRQPSPISELLGILKGETYLTGELVTEEAGLLNAQLDPRYFPSVTVAHSSDTTARLILTFATRQDLQRLPDLWVTGSLVIRRIE